MNTRRLVECLAVAFAVLVPVPIHAAGLLKPADGGTPLAIASHDVDVEIIDGIAVTRIEQVFRNDADRPLEAVYSFPLPTAASLAGFSMWIDGREMDGEVVEKTRARTIYESVVHPEVPPDQVQPFGPAFNRWKDPGLVEAVSYREFQATIFPVPAHGTQKVRLTYYQTLAPEKDIVTYVYPMETRAAEESRVRGRFSLNLTLRSSVPIADCAFPGARDDRVASEASGDRRVVAHLERPDGDLDRDFVMLWRLKRAVIGADLVTWRRHGEDGYFMLLATSPDLPVAVPGPPVDYTFIVDVSGSMRRQRRLELAGTALARFLEEGDAQDRFNLIAFNVAPQALAPRALPNDGASRAEMQRFLARFTGVGGTDLYPALDLAYAQAEPGRRQAFVVLTDGGLNDLDENHARFLSLGAAHDATIFGLALGNDANVPLLQALATRTGGFVAAISTADDLQSRGLLLRERMRQQPLRNLSLEVDGTVQIFDQAPGRIPDLYAGTQIAVLGRYRGDGPATFRLAGLRGEERVSLETAADLGAEGDPVPEIRRLWAERRVFDLLQEGRAGRLPENAAETVVRLGVDYSIVTPLTSFLVLESDAMFREHGIERRSHALLEEEARARAERGRLADRKPIGPEQPPPRFNLDAGEMFGGAVDPFLLLLVLLVAAGPWALRRLQG